MLTSILVGLRTCVLSKVPAAGDWLDDALVVVKGTPEIVGIRFANEVGQDTERQHHDSMHHV